LVPRRKTSVKTKARSAPSGKASTRPVKFRTSGIVDLHFHGAFGIDLMTAEAAELDMLSERLWESGVGAFCPTTLSTGAPDLLDTVYRLGRWIRSESAPGAIPLGLHLEGPFISPKACGAHPAQLIRPLSFEELESLWETSERTIRILTVAPETLDVEEGLPRLCTWARERGVVLSLGHSRASEAQAAAAFDEGFSGVTHAWNALSFHHREAGPLGAALGRSGVHVELIPDLIHVSSTLVRWTRKLHGDGICFVSDCVPAAGTLENAATWHAFGPLQIQLKDGASRLASGALAGGGRLLADSYARWTRVESEETGISRAQVIRHSLDALTAAPLRALKIPAAFLSSGPTKRQVEWTLSSDGSLSVSALGKRAG
jgi:N-acetylglucosamine-6-phosphate deacetylase